MNMNYSNTEEAFVLSSLKEFVKVWGSGRQGYFNLECRNGLACVKLSFDLGHPSDLHCHETNVATPSFFQTKPSRSNGSVRQRKNIERAKAHREKLAAVSAAHSSAHHQQLLQLMQMYPIKPQPNSSLLCHQICHPQLQQT